MEWFYNLMTQESNRKYISIKDNLINNKRKPLINKSHFFKTKLQLSNRIFHFSVSLIDLIIDNEKGIKYKQIGLGCLILAVKYLQNESEIPI